MSMRSQKLYCPCHIQNTSKYTLHMCILVLNTLNEFLVVMDTFLQVNCGPVWEIEAILKYWNNSYNRRNNKYVKNRRKDGFVQYIMISEPKYQNTTTCSTKILYIVK